MAESAARTYRAVRALSIHTVRARTAHEPHPSSHVAGKADRCACMLMNNALLLGEVCDLLVTATDAAARDLPWNHAAAIPSFTCGTWTEARSTRVFLRDRFTDRYFGQRLVFPGTLRALSLLLPNAFPWHASATQCDRCPAYWELFPAIDHPIPLARGGRDDESNAVTTSMARIAEKRTWAPHDAAWPTELAPSARDWDGLLLWFFEAWGRFEVVRRDRGAQAWYRAACITSESTVEGARPYVASLT